MCGIFGFVGDSSAAEILISGLEELEYRGYDSAGMALFTNSGELKTLKEVGRVFNLKNKLEQNINSNCGIAHTRWATHGKPTEENCHPHTFGDVVVVHNGIVENYNALKEKYKANLKTDTDTEIIAFLIDLKLQSNGKTVIEAINEVMQEINGSYACALLRKTEPNIIYIFKKQSPLLVGESKNFNLISSDLSAMNVVFQEHKRKKRYYCLNDYEIAKIEKNNINFYDFDLNQIKKQEILVENETLSEKCNIYKHFMLKEINEIPTAVFNTLQSVYKEANEKIIKEIENSNFITFVGCGTAYHACLVGKYLFENTFNKKVNVELASEFRYNNHVFNSKEIIIAITQSGETADTIAALKLAKAKNLKTLAITNVKNSTITTVADYVIYTQAGKEVAVAATKTFNCQLSVLYGIIQKYKNKINLLKNAEKIEKKLINQINYCKNYKYFNKLFNFNKYFYIGRNVDSVISLEAALKLKEITYVHAEGYPAGELKHGTLSLIDNGSLIVANITKQSLIQKTLNAVHEAKARGANTLIVSQFQELEKEADYFIKLEEDEEKVMPMLSVIPHQYFSYLLSCNKGYNPDKPRNLAKSVTVE